jgi:hypothetical protein
VEVVVAGLEIRLHLETEATQPYLLEAGEVAVQEVAG